MWKQFGTYFPVIYGLTDMLMAGFWKGASENLLVSSESSMRIYD